ncbi:hypothetical protein SAMN04487770_12026 [Butyrivibrio sp. ob235]|uniref:hypothetical protein n=1 Tax=Butyrivibrio sp. ob235 TaxID=1761780 RepID=UPI0008AFF09A|nr:hypothetical protein [Butyrivibrio sp. ob235]SEL89645.1 hypothetical protein SAMN04487770_12026 [Butyrivibrio sp. ob235]
MYSESTLRKKANAVGYSISKGFVHYLGNGYPIAYREVGYNVIDNLNNINVWGCYNEVYDHLWSLEDVNDFIKSIYQDSNLEF